MLTGYSRHDETPREVVVELTDDGYRNVGTPEEAERTALAEAISTVLPTEGEGLTQTEIRNELAEQREISVKHTRLKSIMRAGLDLGIWDRFGTGKRGDPYRYVAKIDGLGRDISQE